MKLSVIIVNYNVRYFLEQALRSVERAAANLAASLDGAQTEIWVVDNNSTDTSLEMLAFQFPDVRVIANKQNTGFSYANNQAIKESKAEYVLLLNPDTVVPEDCFTQTVRFMDAHPDAGALGIKMVDGSGKFLPESKRGFPSPKVAFFKIFGLSRFFPKSKTFGKYHLGYLDEKDIHSVDVLAGAFMLLRMATLNKIGLLDEDFFMYGEDIDFSYRIVKARYKNYYFPYAPIIHYKGESTKKGSVNYVFVFYRAMVIFAKKHLPKDTAALFSVFINLAIYLRAAGAVVSRIVKRLALSVVDFAVLYGAMILLVNYWERTIKYVHGGEYPPLLTGLFVPLYILCWILGVFLFRGYQRPFIGKKLLSGVALGTLLIAVIYAFLDERYRYSRALIILGAAIALIVFVGTRVLFTFLSRKSAAALQGTPRNIAVIGDEKEAARVHAILEKSNVQYTYSGFITPAEVSANSLGALTDLEKIIRIYRINELIFCASSMAYKDIIDYMMKLSGKGIDFKIVPDQSNFIIGSSSKNQPGDYYTSQVAYNITNPEHRLNKRFFDIGSALLLLITLPLNIWFIRNTGTYLSNLFSVLRGQKTWVGYSNTGSKDLPPIKPSVISPIDELSLLVDTQTENRLNYLYAKDYTVYRDLSIFMNGLSKLGRSEKENHE